MCTLTNAVFRGPTSNGQLGSNSALTVRIQSSTLFIEVIARVVSIGARPILRRELCEVANDGLAPGDHRDVEHLDHATPQAPVDIDLEFRKGGGLADRLRKSVCRDGPTNSRTLRWRRSSSLSFNRTTVRTRLRSLRPVTATFRSGGGIGPSQYASHPQIRRRNPASTDAGKLATATTTLDTHHEPARFQPPLMEAGHFRP
jgi:hypothetical protein